MTRSPTPWKRRPNSLALECCQDLLVEGFEMSLRYSMERPVEGSMTELVKNSSGSVEYSWVFICAVRSGASIRACTALEVKVYQPHTQHTHYWETTPFFNHQNDNSFYVHLPLHRGIDLLKLSPLQPCCPIMR